MKTDLDALHEIREQLWSRAPADTGCDGGHVNAIDNAIAELTALDKTLVFSDVDPSNPVGPNELTRRHTWTQFRETGMLWAANRALHIFGWAIVVEYDDDSGDLVDAYPVRTAWRGFDRDAEERGYRSVSRWMERAAAALREESER